MGAATLHEHREKKKNAVRYSNAPLELTYTVVVQEFTS